MQGLSNTEIVRITFDCFNDREFSRADDCVAEDLVWTEVPSGNVFRGRDGLRREYESWLRGFPDGKVEITNLLEAGEWVICEYIITGTNTGPMHGPNGEDLPPTGKSVEIKACDLMQMKDGQVIGGRGYFDTGAFAGA